MQVELRQANIALDAHRALSLKDAAGAEVEVVAGHVWLTMDGDLRDIFLVPGESHSIERRGLTAELAQADATALPYASETFDAVVHYGAINQFGDGMQAAIDEILRVTKAGGLVVLLDEGLPDEKRDGWWGRLLIRQNPLFASHPPMHLLPQGSSPQVRWVVRGLFYEIRLRKPAAPGA